MGRVAPRRRIYSRGYQPVLHAWTNLRQRFTSLKTAQETNDDELFPSPLTLHDRINNTFSWIWRALIRFWHMSDDFDWMEPLPYFHRRWVIIFSIILLSALLWPYSDHQNGRYGPDNVEETVTLTHTTLNDTTVPALLWQQRTRWQNYPMKPGQTLAQLFRANRLDVNDIFAIAQAEGSDKPLNNLKSNQEVRIQHNAQGQVTALEIETNNNEHLYFRRQPDGSFIRIR